MEGECRNVGSVLECGGMGKCGGGKRNVEKFGKRCGKVRWDAGEGD